MEEMLSNVAGARQIFERWMEWEPDEQAWHSYINMELRYKEIDRVRSIYERYILVHPEHKNWVKYAKFEERQSNIGTLYIVLSISTVFELHCNHGDGNQKSAYDPSDSSVWCLTPVSVA